MERRTMIFTVHGHDDGALHRGPPFDISADAGQSLQRLDSAGTTGR